MPIASGLIKLKNKDDNFLLYQINKTPYIDNSDTTLFYEYQIRSYGLVIVSFSKDHMI